MEERFSAKYYGVVIEEGPQNWQILQQVGGVAKVTLRGRWFLSGLSQQPLVFVRVVEENTGQLVSGWERAELSGENEWSAELEIPQGGLYRIESCMESAHDNGTETYRGDIIHHIGVGDLYVIAGQSNAVGFGREAMYDAPQVGVHVLRGSGRWDLASHPLADTTDISHPINRDRVNPGHSPYLVFGKLLKESAGIPIGLIPTALGGSPLSKWDTEEGELYRNMVEIVKAAGGRIRGVLWYQGCSDAYEGFHETYLERFERFVRNCRRDFGDPNLPVLTVQLNRDLSCVNRDEGWGTVREAQRQAALRDKHVYVVPSTDGTTSDIIHNSTASNMAIGQRLANLAKKYIYNIKCICDAPDIETIQQLAEDKLELRFKHVYGKLTFLGDVPSFVVEDDLGEAKLKRCKIDENIVYLTAERELKGRIFVSYQARQNPDTLCVFDSLSMLPALSFYRVEGGTWVNVSQRNV